jgi:DNA-binding PadR family transcriptional regulator
MSRRLSAQTLRVLEAIAATGPNGCHGLEIARTTGLKSGTLYPILLRLADRGMLEHEWQASEGGGRPPRHVYRLSEGGRAILHGSNETLRRPASIEARA